MYRQETRAYIARVTAAEKAAGCTCNFSLSTRNGFSAKHSRRCPRRGTMLAPDEITQAIVDALPSLETILAQVSEWQERDEIKQRQERRAYLQQHDPTFLEQMDRQRERDRENRRLAALALRAQPHASEAPE